jgi:signal transduction histidine kinase
VRARRVQSSEFKVQRGIKDSELRTLNSELDADFIEISVSDTGIGISLENQERLFQPFQQVETSLTRKYSGTGLGLSLCRRFVELHGGRIWIESEPGKGSTFTFVIPVKERL